MFETVGLAGDRIRSFVERIEQLENELREMNEGEKEVFAEAKNEGFDVKILEEVMKLRKQDEDEREEQETRMDVYMRAMSETEPQASAEAMAKAARLIPYNELTTDHLGSFTSCQGILHVQGCTSDVT